MKHLLEKPVSETVEPAKEPKPDFSFTGRISPLDIVRKWDTVPVSHARRYASDEES